MKNKTFDKIYNKMCRMLESRFTYLSPEEITEVADNLEQYLEYAYNLGASSCDDEIGTLEDDINDFETQVRELENEIEKLEGIIKGFEKEVESLNSEIEDCKFELKETVESLKEAQSLFEDIE